MSEAVPAGEEVRVLVFASGGERFALDVGFVREIVPGPEVTPVPFVPDAVAGVVNHRGAIFTVVRFSVLAALEPGAEGTVVLLRVADMSAGVAVDEIEGIVRVPAALLSAGAEGAAASGALVRRTTDRGGRLLHAVDPERLVDLIYGIAEPARSEG